jgi:hypothetical protein
MQELFRNYNAGHSVNPQTYTGDACMAFNPRLLRFNGMEKGPFHKPLIKPFFVKGFSVPGIRSLKVILIF